MRLLERAVASGTDCLLVLCFSLIVPVFLGSSVLLAKCMLLILLVVLINFSLVDSKRVRQLLINFRLRLSDELAKVDGLFLKVLIAPAPLIITPSCITASLSTGLGGCKNHLLVASAATELPVVRSLQGLHVRWAKVGACSVGASDSCVTLTHKVSMRASWATAGV